MLLHHKSYGQGEALIILHGLFGSLDNWVTHARKLAEQYSVFILDQRNHGKSPHHEDFDYELMAEDLKEFMEHYGIYHANLLGHSMGGKTVMQFAAEYPDLVDRLVVVDMAPKTYEPHHTEILAALNGLDLSQIASRQEADEQLAAGIPEFSVRAFLLKSLARTRNGFQWKFNLSSISKHYESILQNIDILYPFEKPTLFLSGGKSDYVQPSDHDAIRENFPQAQFVSIPEAGHWVHAETPDQFLSSISSFLNEG